VSLKVRTCRQFHHHQQRHRRHNVGYLIACSCVEFVLPFVTVATINVLIYLNIRRRSRGLMMASTRSTPLTSSHFISI